MILTYFPQAQPLQGLIGGLLIGLAAAILLLGEGRIAGVSGILARGTGLAQGSLPNKSAWAFIIGLPLGAYLLHLLYPQGASQFFDWPILIVAGLLVGFGTRLGSGCTSGHGVCGVSRLSQRSFVATVVFMISGIAAVFIMSRIGG
jgi:uncharacterized membrane protein YedE/YeeE